MAQPWIAQTSIAASMTTYSAGAIADTTPLHIFHGLNATRRNITVTPTATNSATYTLSISVNGATAVDYTFTADGSATVAEITAGLTALVNAGTQPVTAIDNTTTLSLIADGYGTAGGFTLVLGGSGTMAQADVTSQADVLGFGRFVCYDINANTDFANPYVNSIRLPRVTGDITSNVRQGGVVLDTAKYVKVLTAQEWPTSTRVDVMRKGHVWVQSEQLVTANSSSVFVRYAAGGLGLGSFGTSAGTSERAQLSAGATWRTSCAANGFAVLEVNLVG